MRTDELLRQSQSAHRGAAQPAGRAAADERGARGEGASSSPSRRRRSRRRTSQVELARQELEEKAEQLALTSKYKSQFLANMSHELRTPLNSLLILSRQLADNAEGNLTDKQIRYAETIRQAGTDLMTLINEILDLAKIESGTMAVEVGQVRFGNLRDYVDQTFRQVAEEKGLQFTRRARRGPAAVDRHRRHAAAPGAAQPAVERDQVHRAGRVKLRIYRASARRHRVRGRRYRHRHPAGQAAADLRGVPASGRLDEPQVRRHRPRPRDLARDRRPARRRPARRLESSGQGCTFTLYLPTRLQAARRASRAAARAMSQQPYGQLPPGHRPDAAGRAARRPSRSRRRRSCRARSRARSRTTTRASSRATACCSSSRTT